MDFVFFLHFFKDILEVIAPADKYLQTRTVGYKVGKPIIDEVINNLKEMKCDENFINYYNQAETILFETEPSYDFATQAAHMTRHRCSRKVHILTKKKS